MTLAPIRPEVEVAYWPASADVTDPSIEGFLFAMDYHGKGDERLAIVRRLFDEDSGVFHGYALAWDTPENGWHPNDGGAFSTERHFPSVAMATTYCELHAPQYVSLYVTA